MMDMQREPGRRVVPLSVRTDPAPLDDFAEFLTVTYAPLLNLLSADGLAARVERVTSAQYALTVTGPGNAAVDVTDNGRPLPAHPGSVTGWLLRSTDRTQVVPGDAPLPEVAAAVADLLRD